MLVAHGKALCSPHEVGRGLILLNMSSKGGTVLAQSISGFVIEMFLTGPDGAYEFAAHRLVFGLQTGFILLTTLVYFGSPIPGRLRGGSAT